MRTERGRSRSCLYMRRTSAPALLRKRSTCSSSWIKARLSFRKYSSSQPFGESGAVGWSGEPSPSPTLPEIAREQWIHDAPCGEVMSIDGFSFEMAMLDQQQTGRAERARQPRSEAVGG